MKHTIRAKLIPGMVMLAAMLVLPSTVTMADPAQRPVTITPVCADNGTAQWRIGNPNPNQVTISWTDANSQTNKNASMPYGYTTITTSYDASDASPAVTFEQAGLPDQVAAIGPDSCAKPIENCVDGYSRSNLTFDWSKTGTVTVKTVSDAPLCASVPVYLSAYTLPGTYSGSGIFDDSSVPQEEYASTGATLQAGTNGNVTLQIAVPSACTDYQLDLYYAPEITEVSYSGHGAQLIYGEIYLHTATSCSKPAGGSGATLGESTTKPAELADTGASTTLPTIAAVSLALAAAAIEFSFPAKLKQLFNK